MGLTFTLLDAISLIYNCQLYFDTVF